MVKEGASAAGELLQASGDGVAGQEAPPAPAAQAQLIRQLWRAADEGRAEGDRNYFIDVNWYDAWCAYTGYSTPNPTGNHPGPINNIPLVDTDRTNLFAMPGYILMKNGKTSSDWQEVAAPVWGHLVRWYGGGPGIWRTVTRNSTRRLITCPHPMNLMAEMASTRRTKRPVPLRVPQEATLEQVKSWAMEACEATKDAADIALYDFFHERKHEQLDLKDGWEQEPVAAATLYPGQSILLEDEPLALDDDADGPEVVLEDAVVAPRNSLLGSALTPAGSALTTYSGGYGGGNIGDVETKRPGAARGLAGLGNIGNTCYMASSLQCLAHTVPLMRCFVPGVYKSDINRDNPLGHSGKVALAYGSLMESLWKGGIASVTPRGFKRTIGEIWTQFSGYAQHDSQELLTFLLDALHEDLNRIKKKPYIEEKDADGRPDEVVAAESWSNYKARNDSCVVDAFQGMYKSRVACRSCGYTSIKFDPYMYLSLPLPTDKTRTVKVTVITTAGSRPPTVYAATVPKHGCFGDLYAALGTLLGLPPDDDPRAVLAIAERPGFRKYKVELHLDPKEDLDVIRTMQKAEDWLVYHFPDASRGPLSGGTPAHLFHRVPSKFSSAMTPSDAPPLLMWLSEQELAAIVVREQAPANAGPSAMEFVVQPESPLYPAVDAALRPFKRPKLDPELASERKAPASSQLPTASAEPAPPPPPPPLPPGRPAMDMDVEPASVPIPAPFPVFGDPPASNGDDAPSAAGPSSDAVVENGDVAFEPSCEPSHGQGEDADAGPTPSYLIKRAGDTGNTTFVRDGPDGTKYYALEWAGTSAQAFALDNLSAPQEHASFTEARMAASRASSSRKTTSLQECLAGYVASEKLSGADSWFCPKCKADVDADKKLDLWSTPEVLVILLKRFSHSRYSRDKLDIKVSYPLDGLDLEPSCLQAQAPAPIYDLYAVSNHFGTMSGGHYTAYCKMPGAGGEWYEFNDSCVTSVSPESVADNAAAYVLFYRRRAEARADPPGVVDAICSRMHAAGETNGEDGAMEADPAPERAVPSARENGAAAVDIEADLADLDSMQEGEGAGGDATMADGDDSDTASTSAVAGVSADEGDMLADVATGTGLGL